MRKPIPISELLAQGKATLERLRAGGEAAGQVLAALQRFLPSDVAGHVWSAFLSDSGVLTVVADSGSWATRARYVMPEAVAGAAAVLGRKIEKTVVRVRPRPVPR